MVKVKPNSKQTFLSEIDSCSIHLNLDALPKEGEANQALIKWASQVLKVKKSQVSLVGGMKSRDKVLRIETEMTDEMINEKLLEQLGEK